MELLDRYIAIDNKCAWPNLTLMPDGAIAAVIYGQPCHFTWDAHIECWVSRDAGRSWQYQNVAATPGRAYAAGLTHSGALVVLNGFMTRFMQLRPGPDPSYVVTEKPRPAVQVCRSEDAGRTWSGTESLTLPQGLRESSSFIGLWLWGDVVPLPQGRLAVTGYSVHGDDDRNTVWVSFSDDDGRSWGDGVVLVEGFNETTLLPMAGDGLFAVSRTHGNREHLHIFASDDAGQTWTERGPVSKPKECPGHLCRLNNDAILLTYTVRMRGLLGVFACVSEDEGLTWDAPRALWSVEAKESTTNPEGVDGGYPSSVQLDDGTIVTAYYCSRIPSHQRYHMGVVRWCP